MRPTGHAEDDQSQIDADILGGIKVGTILPADKAYDSNGLNDWLKQRGELADFPFHATPTQTAALQ